MSQLVVATTHSPKQYLWTKSNKHTETLIIQCVLMARDYNFIYSKLIKNESDVVGIIAYSLYKKDKIDFIEKFKKENNKQPTEQDFKPFHETCCMSANIDRYRMQALMILQNFLDDTLSATKKQIENDFEKNHQKIVKDAVEDMKPKGFWYGVGQSIVGGLLFMLIIAAMVFFASLSKQQYTLTIGGNANATIEMVDTVSTCVTVVDKDSLK